MTYREFDTGTWTDPWFEKLSPSAKLLFIYLWTNTCTNQAGIYEISLSRIKFETGIDLMKHLPDLKEKISWFPAINRIWVRKFFPRHCHNYSFCQAALANISKLPENIVKQWIEYNASILKKYNIDTMSYLHGAYTVPTPCETENTPCETENTPCKTENTPCPSVAVAVADAVTDTDTEQKYARSDEKIIATEPIDPIVFLEIPLQKTGELYQVKESEVASYEQNFPGLDVRQSIRNARQWCIANPEKRKTERGINKFLARWLIQDVDGGKNIKSSTKSTSTQIYCTKCHDVYIKGESHQCQN